MVRTTAKQQLYEAQRAKILEGARKAFARKGRAATMADVAAEASISQGLAYRYFASKEEIFQALVEQIFQGGPERMQGILEVPGTPGERLDFLVARTVENMHKHPEIYQLLYQVLSDEATPRDTRGMVQGQIQAFQNVLRQLIVEGQATGEIAEGDPDQLVPAIFACLEGLARWALRDREQFKKHCPDARILLRLLRPERYSDMSRVQS